MGTYTTNYNLYMPTIGETGWGTLVNGNFTTIDTTMKSLSNKLTAVENEINGNISCTSVTTSGKVTANGGLSTKALTATTGTFSGAVTGASFNGTCKTSGSYTVTPSSTVTTSFIPYYGEASLTLLPFVGLPYSGSINFTCGTGGGDVLYYDGTKTGYTFFNIPGDTTKAFSFTGIYMLVVTVGSSGANKIRIHKFTLS